MSGIATDGTPVTTEAEIATAQQWGSEYQTRRLEEVNHQWESEFLAQNPATGKCNYVEMLQLNFRRKNIFSSIVK